MASWASIAKAPAPIPKEDDTQEIDKRNKRIAIVDANAIIGGIRLDNVADRFVTIPEVLNEIRDKQARQFLATLPYTIETKEPVEESTQAVLKFARETGDIHALSAADVKLLALAHTLEVEAHGKDHLREKPVQARVQSHARLNVRNLPGWGTVTNPEEWAAIDAIEDDTPMPGSSRILTNSTPLANDNQSPPAPPSGPSTTTLIFPPFPGESAPPPAPAVASTTAPSVPPAVNANTAGAESVPVSEAGHDECMTEDQEEGGGEEEDGWETAGKSRNALRRKHRKHRRFEERQALREADHAKALQQFITPTTTTTSACDACAPSSSAAQGDGASMSHAEHDEHMHDDDDDDDEEGSEDGSEEGEDEGEDEEGSEGEGEEEGFEEGSEVEEGAEGASTVGGSTTISDAMHVNTTSNVMVVTADFPMQNVLLQMGLRLMSRDGLQITRLSRWALRCSACFLVTKEMSKLFCGRCGNMTMERVEVTVGPDGAEYCGVKKKHILRGTKFSLPKPRGGRKQRQRLILREDQLRKPRTKKKPAANATDDAFAPEFTSETWHKTADLGNQRGALVLMTSWKNNPNEVKRTRSNRRG